jgi:hypothetical protein
MNLPLRNRFLEHSKKITEAVVLALSLVLGLILLF